MKPGFADTFAGDFFSDPKVLICDTELYLKLMERYSMIMIWSHVILLFNATSKRNWGKCCYMDIQCLQEAEGPDEKVICGVDLLPWIRHWDYPESMVSSCGWALLVTEKITAAVLVNSVCVHEGKVFMTLPLSNLACSVNLTWQHHIFNVHFFALWQLFLLMSTY